MKLEFEAALRRLSWETIGESLFTFSASLTYAHHHVMTEINKTPEY